LVGFTYAKFGEDSPVIGDPAFHPPEILDSKPHGPEVDLWQLGIFAYALLSGKQAFKDKNIFLLNAKIRKGEFDFPDSEWKSVSQEAKDFIKGLINIDPTKRFTSKQALDHAFFKKIDGSSLPNVKKNLATFFD